MEVSVMDNSQKAVSGLSTAESLELGGFQMAERNEPIRVQELKTAFIGTYKAKGKSAHSNLYVFETPEGERSVMGCADLDAQMVKIKPGAEVAIIYDGRKQTGQGHEMIKCTVMFKPA
jgi:hypothetical protein